jgi:ubiquinone/menaquinone biosynthesis C-methylase UbiE
VQVGEVRDADTMVSAYDAIAPRFERDRALPDGVAQAVRVAALGAVAAARPRMLDLGAGTGRLGWPFVAAGDDYVGVDLSFGMLQAFAQRAERRALLVQADGHRLPFGNVSFDAVLLIQVFGGIADWQRFVAEVRRVLRPSGAVLIGRTVAPDDGVDARMKRQLDDIIGSQRRGGNRREDVARELADHAAATERRIVATWSAQRTPRQFLERHRGGARFSALPQSLKDDAMRQLGTWAERSFGALDVVSSESHAFELQLFKLKGEAT